jgi:hypothetical protein
MNKAIEQLEKEYEEAVSNFSEAVDIEEADGYSDAMLSIDRAFADGYADALKRALEIVKKAI